MGKTIFICKLCREKYSSLDGLYSHLESEHGDAIPEDMCVEQFYYFLKTGKEHGKCVECGKPTLWNDKTKKYKRFCEDPECMEKYKETVRNRMIGKYGKVNLLNDPEQQRKMLMNRKISGLYDFNGVKIPYVGSYELDFLKTMDLFLDWDPNDIIMPSPHNYYYMYNGEKKFYIPDVFIPSLGLEIEIKDGGNNPNMHHKIQDVDKEKERLKDEVMSTQKIHHYIKITNKNYYNLFDFFDKMKEGLEKYGDYDKIPKIIITEDIKTKQVNPKSKSLLKKESNEILKEGTEIIEESSNSCKNLYFISENNMDNKTLNPRIPNNYFTKNGFEDNKTKRVCFCSSVGNCLKALSMNCKGKEFFVHIPTGDFNVVLPTKNQVPDSEITGEKWILNPVKIKCVGKIKVLDDDKQPGETFNYGNNSAELYGWKWTYVEKYYENNCTENLSKYINYYGENESSYTEIAEEGYLFSKDDLYINFDKFESGESNICLITGLSGSGKSTLGKSLANKYNAEYVELDTFFVL